MRVVFSSIVLLLAASNLSAADPPSFRFDVLPTLTRAGCNAGICHGTPTGKSGFRLSLRGFDPQLDFATLTREVDGRRINRLRPEQSLILQKATAQVAHLGGRRFRQGDTAWNVLFNWIKAGAPIDSPNQSSLVQLTIDPSDGIVDAPVDRQTFRVAARYSDGLVDDVTDRSRFSITDENVAELAPNGEITRLKRGEVTVTAEFAGSMVSARVLFRESVPEYREIESLIRNPIDSLVFDRLKSLQIESAGAADDSTFVRRVYLDVSGRLPTVKETRDFRSDASNDKRTVLIDRLLAGSDFADWWAMKWIDRLGCNQRFVGKTGAIKYHAWVRHHMAVNTPHDEFARRILTAGGANYSNPPAGFWRRLRIGGIGAMDPLLAGEEISQLFMGVRIQCARCHNHPGEKWTQDDYYGLAAFFPRVKFQSGPFFNHRYDQENIVYSSSTGEVTHARTGAVTPPKFPAGELPTFDSHTNRRAVFADWLVSPNNQFFAKAAVNRIWFHLFGRGIVDPVDDFRVSNPPSHPQLLDFLAEEFVAKGFDRKHIIRLILNSSTYQLDFRRTATGTDDGRYFSFLRPRKLQAEQLLDAISAATGSAEPFSEFPSGTTAVSLPDGEYKHPFLEAFGRPARALACECERESVTTISQAIQITGGSTLHRKLASDTGRAAKLAASNLSTEQLIDELWLATISRSPTADEKQIALNHLKSKESERRHLIEDVLWNLINHVEFLFQH